MVDKSELAIATSQPQNPIPFLIELLFNLLSQRVTVSTIKLTSQPVSYPSLKQRTIAALRAGGGTAIDEFFLENKYLKVGKAIVQAWLQPSS